MTAVFSISTKFKFSPRKLLPFVVGLLFLATLGCSSIHMHQRKQPPPGDEPILLIHGFADAYWMPQWQRLYTYLQKLGYPRDDIRRINLGWVPGTTIQSPRRYGRKICSFLESNYPEQEIDVIAHSMGGLSTRWCIQQLGGAAHVDDLITLGTPHQGVGGLTDTTAWFRYFGYSPPTSIREMQRGGEFIRKLNGSSLPESVEFTAVWSRLDYVYFLSEYWENQNAFYPEHLADQPNVKNMEVPFYAGHLDLISDKRVLLFYKHRLD